MTTAMVVARSTVARAFLAILWRDLYVSGKGVWLLLVQVTLTPLFLLFIFAKVLGSTGYVNAAYGELLLPGIVAMSAFLTALQSVAFPLVMEFGWSKEIEDRLLAPLPTGLVATEKLLVATLQGLLSAILMFPAGVVVLGAAPWRLDGLPLLLVVLLLGAWVGAGIGITMGTLVPPAKIGIAFGLVLTPLLFTGATYYPWPVLGRMPWFQVITALNPLTYCAEGVRAAMVPHVPHLAPWICVSVLAGAAAVFTTTGLLAFQRRALS